LLREQGVTLQQVFTALQNNNLNIGGNILRGGQQALVVRGIGLLKTLDNIRNVPITTYNARPVYVKDVATVNTGPAPRLGITGFWRKTPDGEIEQVDDIIEAVVLNLAGTDALKVIGGIKKQVDHLNKDVLPAILPGAQIIPTYDRTDLVETTVHTVLHNLLLGALLILAVSVLFTTNLRAAIVIWMVIPLALLSAFIFLYIESIPANLLSFGAVDFGILVDAAIFIVEGILVARAFGGPRSDFPDVVKETTSALARPMLFSQLILIVTLIPIFTFQHVEGRLFRPMALTFAGAIVGAVLVTFTLVPLASTWLLRPGSPAKIKENFLTGPLKNGYGWLLNRLLKLNVVVFCLAGLLAIVTILMAMQLGTEFIPKLDEGNIWLDVNMAVSISPEAAKENERKIRAVLATFPESREIVTQLGRPEDGYDDAGWNHIEIADFFLPTEKWITRGSDGKVVDKDGLIQLMNQQLQKLPGCDFHFSQYIEDNIEEALSGVQGQIVVKLFGDDLKLLQEKGEELVKIINTVPGNAGDAECEQLSGQQDLNITIDRAAIARYGLDAQTVLSLVQTGLGGQSAGNIIEGRRTFALSVRLDQSARTDVGHIADLWVDTPSGQRIPLKSLTHIELTTGNGRIMSDYNRRRIAVDFSVRGRDLGGFVADAQKAVKEQLKVPADWEITWEGEFQNQQRANARLRVIVPLSLTGVFILLFWAFRRFRYAMLVLCEVPFAVTGGVMTLYLTHTNMSVSATIGFIALAAVSVQNGMILISEFNHLRAKGLPLREAVTEGSRQRVRPVLMTALIAGIGMLPMALSHGVGSEVQRPLARVIVGGMVSALLLTLCVLPVLYELVERRFPAEVTLPELAH
jgi:cobalt-zinc-cadmium resistance protein CzcA